MQRCCVHKLRNLECKAPKHALAELREDFHRIVYAAGGDSARAANSPRPWARRHTTRCEEYSPSRRNSAPTAPGVVHVSASLRMRRLYSAEYVGQGCITCFLQILAHLWKESSVSSTTRSIGGRSGRKTSRQASIPFCLAAPPAQPPTLSMTW